MVDREICPVQGLVVGVGFVYIGNRQMSWRQRHCCLIRSLHIKPLTQLTQQR